MKSRVLAPAFVFVVLATAGANALAGDSGSQAGRASLRTTETALPAGYMPAAIRQQQLGRYFVVMKAPAVADRIRAEGGNLSKTAQVATAEAARASQAAALAQAKQTGGQVVFRYDTLLNGFSAKLSPSAAEALERRSDVASVEPVAIVQRHNESSMPFIGATAVNDDLGIKGQGMKVAVVDDGIDYTHANFGGPGTIEAYESNDPAFIEPGTFPTKKVRGGYDFVGAGYDVLDDDTSNDTPRPDDDPLDDGGGHGSHTAGTVAGIGVPGEIGPGAAPKAKVYSYKVWGAAGDSSDDVLVAAYERAVDPNQDGDTSDRADVLSFSGGVDYGTLNSAEAHAAQRVVDLGTVFVASAGNSGNQNVGGSAYIQGTPASARGVISVAASIDQYNAQTITINSPSGVNLPDNGIMVEQDFGGSIPDGGLTADLYDTRQLDPPASPGNETPADALLCSPVAPGSLTGKIALVFKGSTGEGDCGGSLKVYNAQQAGAVGVVLISLFGGFPSALSSGGEPITIPATMITADDGYAILDALSPSPPAYNSATVNATLDDDTTPIPGFEDSLTDFTSEGPARLTSDLKPDISAPGFDIQSTAAGTGDEGVKLSGTSMAAPHISGVAVLLRQIHPKFSPKQIKALLMNYATRRVKNNDLSSPAPATAAGAGRVQALESAQATSVAVPGSLSFGLKQLSAPQTETQSFKVTNFGKEKHSYSVSAGGPRYSDFDPAVSQAAVTPSSFGLKPGKSKRVKLSLTVDPTAISEADQENGLYYFLGTQDGVAKITESEGPTKNKFFVTWGVVPGATSDNSLSTDSLDLSGGSDEMNLVEGPAAGVSQADLYNLGYEDDELTRNEADIVAVGARSFTGPSVEDATAEGVPGGSDAFAGIGFLDFIADPDPPSEPIEFGVQASRIHNTTETLQVDVLVDVGADGVFAGDDEGLQGDYLISKPAAAGGEVCVFDLSQPDALDDCAETYFADYSNYNSNLTGLVVSAGDLGLTDADSAFSYGVTACTGTFSGDIPGQICDSAGEVDPDTGTYDAEFDPIDPPLAIDPLVCKGFWGGPDCDSANPIEVTGDPGPSVLALFPNNAPSRTPTIVSTDAP